jgi:integrase
MTLRKRRRGKGPWSIIIDHTVRPRSTETLDLKLTGDKTEDDENLRIAHAVFARKVAESNARKHNIPVLIPTKMSFVEYFETLSNDRRRGWKTALLHVKAYFPSWTTLVMVDTNLLEGFQKYLLANVKQNTAATYYDKVVAALNVAVRKQLLVSNPANKLDGIKRITTMRQYLVLEEIQKLVATPCKHEGTKRAFLFACFTGLRFTDLRNLTERMAQHGRIQLTQEKTGAPVYMPLSEQAMLFLGEIGNSNKKIFDMANNQYTSRVITEWVEAAGINKHVTFHTSRHTFATLALTSDVDVMVLKELLGHTSLKNTLIYAKIIDARKNEGVKKLPTL